VVFTVSRVRTCNARAFSENLAVYELSIPRKTDDVNSLSFYGVMTHVSFSRNWRSLTCLSHSQAARELSFFIFYENVQRNVTYRTDIYGLLAKCLANMVGYWPSSSCVFMSRSINSQKKNRANIQPLSIKVNKGFVMWLSGNFFLRDMAGSPERAVQLCPARSANHIAGVDSSCQLEELNCYMTNTMTNTMT